MKLGGQTDRRVRLQWIFAAFGATAVLMAFPIANGFPFMFADTGTYITAFRTFRVPWDRPVFYSIFVAVSSLGLSLWLTVLVQAVMSAVISLLFVNKVLRISSPTAAGIGVALTFAITPAPWIAAQLMPDIFTGLMILGILSLLLASRRMDRWEIAACALVIVMATAFHLGNWVIALGTTLSVALVNRVAGRSAPLGSYRVVTACIAAGLVAVLASNVAARGQISLSPGSNVFLFSKLLDDGPGFDVLNKVCPGDYKVCAERDGLLKYAAQTGSRPSVSDHFLWEGPLERLGWVPGFREEANQLVRLAFRDIEWTRQVVRSAGHAFHQFFRFDINDLADPLPAEWGARKAVETFYGLGAAQQASTSAQITGRAPFRLASQFYAVVVATSLVLMAGMWVRSRGAYPRSTSSSA
ncbi:hypothetical protein [Alsobacter sp. R-9]